MANAADIQAGPPARLFLRAVAPPFVGTSPSTVPVAVETDPACTSLPLRFP